MKMKIFIAIVIVVAVLAGLAGVKALQIGTLIGSAKTFKMPPETISAAVAQEQSWQDTLTAVGSITAAQGGDGRLEIAGTVTEIAFESGAVVAKGDLLARQDTASEAAQLRAAEAEVELAKLNLDRLLKLRESKVVSQSGSGHVTGGAETEPGERRRDQRHHRKENHPRTVRRTAGHPAGEPR